MEKDLEIAELKREIADLKREIAERDAKPFQTKQILVVERPNKIKFDGIFEGKRILLVEDISINREIALQMLSITKVSVDIAENGMIALNKFKESDGKYDMILMDIQMPLMSGTTATQKIRKLPLERATTVPIIAMSSNALQEDIDNYIKCGMNSYISKPVSRDGLINKMAQYFG